MDHPYKNELRGVSGQKRSVVGLFTLFLEWYFGLANCVLFGFQQEQGQGGGGGRGRCRNARQLSVHISWITSIQEMTKGVDEQKRSVVGLLIISRVELRSGKLGIV